MSSSIDDRLRKDRGRRQAALNFAEDFVLTLRDTGDQTYVSNSRLVQRLARHNLGHEFNQAMVDGLVVFFRSTSLHKDNQYIFMLASFVCDLLDDRLDIRRTK